MLKVVEGIRRPLGNGRDSVAPSWVCDRAGHLRPNSCVGNALSKRWKDAGEEGMLDCVEKPVRRSSRWTLRPPTIRHLNASMTKAT